MKRRRMTLWVQILCSALLFCLPRILPATSGACPGDCNRDGAVTVDEIVRSVGIALGSNRLSLCPAIDQNGDEELTVDEIVRAVVAALNGCSVAPPSATPSPTPTATPTATPRPNRAPELALPLWYRAYAGYPVALPLPVHDPDGDIVHCRVAGLPATAEWDDAQKQLRWTPTTSDTGVHQIDFDCEDTGEPPLARSGTLVLSVALADACSEVDCDPALGCSRRLVSVAAPCCSSSPPEGIPDSGLPCPAGRVLWISEDIDGGFRPLRDCDLKYIRNNLQQSAQVRFKFGGRCFSLDDRIRVRVHLETASRGLEGSEPAVDAEYLVRFSAGDNDQVFSGPVAFDIRGPRPYFDLQDAEGNLTVRVQDALNHVASESLRLRLTFTPVPTPGP
jgi:hypothetical protein